MRIGNPIDYSNKCYSMLSPYTYLSLPLSRHLQVVVDCIPLSDSRISATNGLCPLDHCVIVFNGGGDGSGGCAGGSAEPQQAAAVGAVYTQV